MDWVRMMNPLASYRSLQNWRERRRYDCTVTINKPNMMIKGKLQNYEENPYRVISFLGIPYAHPPLGELRFQPPQPLSEEDVPRVLDAYWYPECCIQRDFAEDVFKGSEDCLYLNVHIPHIPTQQQELLPVFVYIHGGGFIHGNSNYIDLDHMVGKQECVCVTIHYRLGALGFLNMRTENCRGNAGLKDQVMALQWISDNIKPFGGDPKNVTICGQSAGGSCVNFHMISPLSKGLFHKAIVMSGGVYCPWGYGGSARRMKQLYKWAIGKENVSRHVAVKMLKIIPADELLGLNRMIFAEIQRLEPRKIAALLRPSVECIREDAFLPDTVEKLMSVAEPVPTIAGMTKQEGYMFFRILGRRDPIAMVRVPEEFFDFLKSNLNWTDASVRRNLNTLRDLYFPNLDQLSETQILENLAKLVTDIHFRRFYDNFKIGNLLKDGSHPFYVYLFDYFSGVRVMEGPHVPHFHPCASEHGDDLTYLLYKRTALHSLAFFSVIDEEFAKKKRAQVLTVAEYLNELWASFCRDSEPKCYGVGVRWIPHLEDDPRYLRISKELEMCRDRLNQERWQALNDICANEEEVASLASDPEMSAEEDDE